MGTLLFHVDYKNNAIMIDNLSFTQSQKNSHSTSYIYIVSLLESSLFPYSIDGAIVLFLSFQLDTIVIKTRCTTIFLAGTSFWNQLFLKSVLWHSFTLYIIIYHGKVFRGDSAWLYPSIPIYSTLELWLCISDALTPNINCRSKHFLCILWWHILLLQYYIPLYSNETFVSNDIFYNFIRSLFSY